VPTYIFVLSLNTLALIYFLTTFKKL